MAGAATTALAGGLATTYAANPDAGVHDYALAMGLSAINPIGGAVGLAGSGTGYGVNRALGGDGRTA